MSRRGVVKGIGGLAALSMSSATVADVQAALNDPLPTDPHTRDTYRSIVDAIVPRTPELGDELGPEHVPGGLDVELEKFIVWDFNHFQEVRLETLRTPAATNAPSAPGGGTQEPPVEPPVDPPDGLPTDSDALSGGTTAALDDVTGAVDSIPAGVDRLDGPGAPDRPGRPERPDGPMDPDLFRVDLPLADAGSDLDALLGLAGVDDGALAGVTDVARFEELLGFGDVERFEVDFAADLAAGASGPAEFEVVVETATDAVHRVLRNYPYAPVFPFAFDVVAAEFLLRGENEDDPAPNEQFPAGGTFVRLSREDRLRCLWTIVDGGALDRLDGLLSPMLPQLGILKFVVMAVNGLHGFGYYTEWAGYGATKTDPPSDRELVTPAGRVQSRDQTGYPGPAPGYAADWRHAVPGGFRDPPAEALDLPRDLTGEDVLTDGDDDGTDDGGGA